VHISIEMEQMMWHKVIPCIRLLCAIMYYGGNTNFQSKYGYISFTGKAIYSNHNCHMMKLQTG
jgi:hypothetical protein